MIPSTVSTGGSCCCGSSSHRIIITTHTTTSDSSFRNHKSTVSTLMYHYCRMVRYQFRIILCVTIIYIIITMTRTIPTTTFLNHHHDTSSSILADCSGMMGHTIQNNNDNNQNQNHFGSSNSESSESTNRGIDWSLYPYEVDGVTVLQMQHMLNHLSSSSSSSGNILIWMGTQFTSQMMSENDPHNHSFQQMILFWNSVANYYNNGSSIIVLLIETNDDKDHDYFSARSSTLRTKITTTQAYYNAIHKRYPQLYFYTIKYTTKSNNVYKQFRYYSSSANHYNNNNNHNAIWEEQLDITTIIPSIVYTTSFDMIWINRPGKKGNIGVHYSSSDPVAGPFQAIYMTQQIIHSSFHLRTRHDNTNIMNHNNENDNNIAVAEVQPLHHPVHVFVAMDANQTNDNELKHLSTSTTTSRNNNNHNINIEKKFSNLVFDRRPIRIIPSTFTYNTTTSTTPTIDNGLNLNTSSQFYSTYDMAQYIFYDHDPYMIIPGRSDDD